MSEPETTDLLSLTMPRSWWIGVLDTMERAKHEFVCSEEAAEEMRPIRELLGERKA